MIQAPIHNYKIRRAPSETATKKLNIKGKQGVDMEFTCSGFLFLDRVTYEDPWDYFDFHSRTWAKEELYHDLVAGVLPVGMILKPRGHQPVVVMPDERGQRVMNLTEVL